MSLWIQEAFRVCIRFVFIALMMCYQNISRVKWYLVQTVGTLSKCRQMELTTFRATFSLETSWTQKDATSIAESTKASWRKCTVSRVKLAFVIIALPKNMRTTTADVTNKHCDNFPSRPIMHWRHFLDVRVTFQMKLMHQTSAVLTSKQELLRPVKVCTFKARF
jgi:hypothetical protein